jgi:hypothetical protein
MQGLGGMTTPNTKESVQPVKQKLGDILNAFRGEHIEFNETVGLLMSYFQTLSVNEHTEYFDALAFHYSSDQLGAPRALHAAIIHVWAAVGPTDDLLSLVFSRVEWSDPVSGDKWALNAGAQFAHSFGTNQARFSSSSLDRIKAQCATLGDLHSPARLVELVSRLNSAVEKIKVNRIVNEAARTTAIPQAAHVTKGEPSLKGTDRRIKSSASGRHTRRRQTTEKGIVRAHPLPTQQRAATVARLIRELNDLKPEMNSEADYHRLTKRFPKFLCFRIARKQESLRTKLENIQGHRQHIRLAQEMTAAYHGKTFSTIETDWKKHKPREFKKKR